MRGTATISPGPVPRATRRPPGRPDSHTNWTDRRGPVNVVPTGCFIRDYSFSKNGNRTGLTTTTSVDNTCTSSTSANVTNTYDAADRTTNSGYSYDKFGRTLTVPSTDTKAGAGGSTLNLDYFSNDMVASQTQGSLSKTLTLDPAMRLRGATDKTSGTETRRILNHYPSPGDSPSWISSSTDAGTTWTWQRNVAGISGGLAILQDSTGATPKIQLSNPHGDVIATLDDTTTASSFNAYFEQTEYGAPRTTNSSNPPRYGWLGTEQRSIDDLAGLSLMGARLYNPTTGRFLSVDPVDGGNDNGYNYPNDPVNASDTSGMCGCLKSSVNAVVKSVAGTTVKPGELEGKLGPKVAELLIYALLMAAYCQAKTQFCTDPGIPRPGKSSNKSKYYIYEIDIWHVASQGAAFIDIWKYGISRVKGDTRMRDGRRDCNRYFSSDSMVCSSTVLVDNIPGYTAARVGEYSLIVMYYIQHGYCPIGQPSCK